MSILDAFKIYRLDISPVVCLVCQVKSHPQSSKVRSEGAGAAVGPSQVRAGRVVTLEGSADLWLGDQVTWM